MYWRLGLQYINLGRDTIQPITKAMVEKEGEVFLGTSDVGKVGSICQCKPYSREVLMFPAASLISVQWNRENKGMWVRQQYLVYGQTKLNPNTALIHSYMA